MTLYGRAFMIMWHDITPEGEAEYHDWHSNQHMPERLAHRGFLRSRRGVNRAHDIQRIFTLYEAEVPETFLGDDYAQSLNHPTDWTTRVAPSFRNFLRSACSVEFSAGRGVGGALASLRGDFPAGMAEEAFIAALEPGLAELASDPLICGVHLGIVRDEFTNGQTRETELRPPMSERPFQYVVVFESYGLKEVEEICPRFEELLRQAGCEELVVQSYDMAYTIEKRPE